MAKRKDGEPVGSEAKSASPSEPQVTPAITSEKKSELPAIESPPLLPSVEPVTATEAPKAAPVSEPEVAVKREEIKIDPPAEVPKASTGATILAFLPRIRLRPRHRHYAQLAACVVIALALGGAVGAFAFGGSSRTDVAALQERKTLQQSVEQLNRQVATLKGDLNKANKLAAEKTAALEKANKLALDKTTSKTAHNQIAKLTDRFENGANGDATGSIPAPHDPAIAPPPQAAPVPMPRPAPHIAATESRPTILQDWTIHDARGGYIFVRGHGEIYQVIPGAPLPGLGTVQAIRRENGAWVVVTTRGLIVASRDRRNFE